MDDDPRTVLFRPIFCNQRCKFARRGARPDRPAESSPAPRRVPSARFNSQGQALARRELSPELSSNAKKMTAWSPRALPPPPRYWTAIVDFSRARRARSAGVLVSAIGPAPPAAHRAPVHAALDLFTSEGLAVLGRDQPRKDRQPSAP